MSVKARMQLLGRLMVVLMLLPLLPGLYFTTLKAHELNKMESNPRNVPRPELRGRILDRAARPLAFTKNSKRHYPYGRSAAPVVGYFDLRLGTAGAEALFSESLEGQKNPRDLEETLEVASEGEMGRDVVITIDAEMQKKAYQLLNGRRGAIVLLLVQTGEPLVLASFPSYDPRKLGDVWDDLSRDPSHPLLNRAVAGLYPPGSTFKVMTAAAGLDEMTVTSGQIFHCDGSYSYGDYTLYDSSKGAHGGISLADAITVSCNVTFAQVGRDLGLERISSWMEKLKLTARSEGLPGSEAGVVPQVGEGASGAIQAGFGQGSVLVTPFGMARLAALIGREGKDIEPSLRSAELVQGSSRQTASGQARQVLDAKAAAYVKKAMRRVVEEGTGGAAAVKGHTVAGKTGTAENAQGEPHAWFIGFAPAEEPLFAVAVVVENAGYGGRHAAPIAASVLETALNSRLGPSNGR